MNQLPARLNFSLEMTKLDFICQRLTSGQMDYVTSQNVAVILAEIQQQANDLNLNPRQLNLVESSRMVQEDKNG